MLAGGSIVCFLGQDRNTIWESRGILGRQKKLPPHRTQLREEASGKLCPKGGMWAIWSFAFIYLPIRTIITLPPVVDMGVTTLRDEVKWKGREQSLDFVILGRGAVPNQP
jgi:hypothetical protein